MGSSTAREREFSLQFITPRNRHDFELYCQVVSQQEHLPQPVRRLLFKTAKSFDHFSWQTTQAAFQIQAQSQQIEQLKARKQKKVAINANEVFADIVKIREAQEQVKRQQAARDTRDRQGETAETARVLLEGQINRFMHKWHVNAPIEDSIQ